MAASSRYQSAPASELAGGQNGKPIEFHPFDCKAIVSRLNLLYSSSIERLLLRSSAQSIAPTTARPSFTFPVGLEPLMPMALNSYR